MLPLLHAVLVAHLTLTGAPALRAATAALLTDSLPALTGLILAPPEGTGEFSVRGTAALVADGPGRATLVLHISHGAPGEQHTFQLYLGKCGDDQFMVPSKATAIAVIDDEGHANAAEDVAFEIPASGVFHVNVRDSGKADGPLAGCANLGTKP
jgi:hypothetical protein